MFTKTISLEPVNFNRGNGLVEFISRVCGMPLRNAVMKRHRWGEDPGADMVQTGKLIGQGIGKLGAFVKHRAATRRLPENLARLAAAIDEFRPARKYDYEFPYQIELTGFLKAKLGGSITIEETRGRSRPDIVIDRTIAIEIKGPTSNHQLDTIADKAVRYGRHFEGGLVCVLFDVLDPVRFREWEAGMRDRFPDILIFPK